MFAGVGTSQSPLGQIARDERSSPLGGFDVARDRPMSFVPSVRVLIRYFDEKAPSFG